MGNSFAANQLLRRPGQRPTGVAVYEIKVYEDQTVNTVLDDAFVFEIPEDLDASQIVKVEAFITTAGGSDTVVNIRAGDPCDTGTDILSTPITIDSGECNSKDASVQPVISGGTWDVSWGDHIHIDVDQASGNGLGVIITLTPNPLGSVVLQGAQGAQGAPGGITAWTGPWDSGTTYTTNEAVSHNGSSYAAVQGSTDVEPGVDSGWEDYWQLLAEGVSGSASTDGWTPIVDTLTYATDDDPTFTLTISGDFTGTYQAGQRLKLTQTTGGTKYFIITKVAFGGGTTTLTIYGGASYDLENEAITDPFYSVAKAPFGMPMSPVYWTESVNDSVDRAQASPVNGTWYNLGTILLDIPIGSWRVYYEVNLKIENTASDTALVASATLSTANNTQSDSTMTGTIVTADANAAGKQIVALIHREHTQDLTSKTTYYLNGMSQSGGTALNFRGDLGDTVIRAISAYL